MINKDGEKVSLAESDNVISARPGVEEAMAFGVEVGVTLVVE